MSSSVSPDAFQIIFKRIDGLRDVQTKHSNKLTTIQDQINLLTAKFDSFMNQPWPFGHSSQKMGVVVALEGEPILRNNNFPSHFILSLIDVYRDIVTRDNLIFPSFIMRLLRHFSISFPESLHFTVISAIDAATVRQSEAQLRWRQPRIETTTPLASTTPSTTTPSSSVVGVAFKAIMA